MPEYFRSPAHWQQRAEEARLMAERMTDKRSHLMMMAVADSYEKLAAFATKAAATRVSLLQA